MRDKKIAVWFSCGVASAVALRVTLDIYGQDNEVIALNNPVIEEHEDNERFLKDVENWLGIKIEKVTNSKYPNASAYEVWEKRKYMSGIKGAPCTLELKKKARQEWENNNKVDYHVLGFTADEVRRHERFILTERNNVLPVLIDAELSKQDCMDIILKAGIKPPIVYSLGLPNANCLGCVKSTAASYWDLIRKQFPDVFKERVEQSRRLGVKLVRYHGKRIFLDELPDKVIRKPIRKTIECGIFCEEDNA